MTNIVTPRVQLLAHTKIDEDGKMFVGHVDFLPAVVFATGAQVRAAREAMEQEHG